MGILRTDKISGLETPTAVTGSVSFDGNDHLEIGAAGDFNFLHNGLSDWTAEFWVKTGSATRQFAFGTGASSAQTGFHLNVMSTADGQADGTGLFAMFGRASAGNFRFWGSNNGLIVNTWHHVAAVFKSSDRTLALYVDGKEVDNDTGTENGTFSTTDYSTSDSSFPFVVAKNRHADTFLTGEISNLRVVSGRRLYTSNFTPPVHALETINGTRILCCNNPDSVTAVSNAGIGIAHTTATGGDPTVGTDYPGLTRDFTFGTQFEGVSRFDTQAYFVPPSGTTEQRGRGRGIFGAGTASPGSSNLNSIEYIQIQTQGNAQDFGDLAPARTKQGGGVSSSTRGITGGGFTSVNTEKVEFIIISTTGNALDYGDLSTAGRNIASASNSTRGIFAGGDNRLTTIDFLTIESGGLAASFGSLPSPGRSNLAGCASPTRALFGGGYSSGALDTIEHVTIATTGSLQDFGNLSVARFDPAPCSSSTRGIFAGGATPSPSQFNTIDFVTIATLGNAQDFGDLIVTQSARNGTSNSVRGVFAGGTPSFTNTIDFITIASTGDAQDFGDLIVSRSQAWSCSDSHGGLS